MWEYLGSIARQNGMTAVETTAVEVGGVEDHVHVLVQAAPALAPGKIAQLLKGGSSLWIGTQFPEIRHFGWQDGYGAFTVNPSMVAELRSYIRNQNHRQRSFQEEYLEFLKKHGIAYDDRYVWVDSTVALRLNWRCARCPGLERPG